MTIDTKALRRTHVDGWRPRQSVEIDVETLRALLDELDELRANDPYAELACEACGKRPAPIMSGDGECHFCERCADEIREEEAREHA